MANFFILPLARVIKPKALQDSCKAFFVLFFFIFVFFYFCFLFFVFFIVASESKRIYQLLSLSSINPKMGFGASPQTPEISLPVQDFLCPCVVGV
jgi:hypothetical protein